VKHDYLIVGYGLYGAIFAHEAKAHGKKVLVVDKRPNIAGNIYTENIEGINVHSMVLISFIPIIKRFGIILHNSRNLIALRTPQWLTIKVNCTRCLSTCIRSIRCGVL